MKKLALFISVFFVISSISAQQANSQPNYQPDYMIQQFETGSPIEGDLVSGIDLSSDGTKLFVSHRHSGNVFVYDADTYDTIAVIKAARGIIDTHLTDSCLYLCCRDTRQLFIIDVTDYSIKNSFEIDDDAIQVEVSSDEQNVLVGFNSFHDGWITAYNTNTGEVVYQSDEPMIDAYGTTNNIPGRTLLAYYSFDMSPKGNQFIARITDNYFRNYPGIFDAYTGALIRTIKHETLRASQYSETGDTLYLLTNNQGSGLILRRIDCSDFSTIDSILMNESIDIGLFYQNLALYNNGSTVFIPINFVTEPVYVVFDFTSNSYQYFSSNNSSLLGNQKIEQSPDKRFVFIQQWFTYQVFDLETNQIRGEFPFRITCGSRLCVADDGERLFVSKPGYNSLYDQPQEGLLVMDYSDPDNVFKDTLLISAELPEADQASSAVISRDGLKLYVLNPLSLSLSIIDVASQSVDTIVDFPEIYEKITPVPKGDLIFLTGTRTSNSLLFDPISSEVIADIDAPRTYAVRASSNGQYLYTITDTGYLRKIEVNGENSEIVIIKLVNLFQRCGSGGRNLFEIHEGPFSTFGISPDGKYILGGVYYGAIGESYVEVMLTETLETVDKVPVENACIFDYVFTDDSKRVCVLSSNVDKPIIYLDSVNSYIENIITHNEYMYSGQYNPSDSMFYLLNRRDDYWIVDPISGEVVDTVVVNDDYKPLWQLVLDEDGNVLIRRNSDLYHAGNFYDLPAASRSMYFDLGLNTCVIPIPGPDLVCLFNPLHVGSQDGGVVEHHYNVKVYPNPAFNQITIDAKESLFTKIEILDVQGKLVYSRNFNNFKTTIGTEKIQSGIYFIRVHFNKHFESRKLIIQ